MKCPKCTEKMEPTNSSGIQTYTCLYCSGIWVPENSMMRLMALENKAETPRELLTKKDSKSCANKLCPTCLNTSLNSLLLGGIEIDYCKTCYGIFFDKNEIQNLLPKKYKPDVNYSGLLFLEIVLSFIFAGLS